LAPSFFPTDYNIATAAAYLRNKGKEHAAFIGLAGARHRANYYELARAMRVRFFGFFASVFINRARPIPGRIATPIVNASFCTA
jgi:hypothetical protein